MMQGPLVALAFKLEEGRFGQLTYMRIYSGAVRKGDPIVNSTNGKRIKVSCKRNVKNLLDVTVQPARPLSSPAKSWFNAAVPT